MSGRQPTVGEWAHHWDRVYASRSADKLSWHQDDPRVSRDLLQLLGINSEAGVVDIGGGASCFAAQLVARGFKDVTVLDVSATALAEARHRAGSNTPIVWLRRDLLAWRPERRFDLWHDRAVLHFLIDEDDRARYVQTMEAALAPGGSAVIGVFAEDGPDRCSALPVARYSTRELATLLGRDFDVVATRREEHVTPGGVVQPFSWIAARRAD